MKFPLYIGSEQLTRQFHMFLIIIRQYYDHPNNMCESKMLLIIKQSI